MSLVLRLPENVALIKTGVLLGVQLPAVVSVVYVVACTGHMDEVTFHLHFTVVPIILGQAAEWEDTKKQFEKRNGKEKRRYRKQEVTARLCARDVFTQENAERWQTEYALHMQAAGFDLERGIHGSKAKHMDPAVYNAIKAEEAKLEAEKDGLKVKKEELEDEVDTLQSEKDALTIEIETLNREKKQAETAERGLSHREISPTSADT